jgi:hypothetical protein
MTQRGRASHTAEHRHPSLFRLTYRPTETAPATDEWRRIKTIEGAEMIQQDARVPTKKPKTPLVETTAAATGYSTSSRADSATGYSTSTSHPEKPPVPLYSGTGGSRRP